MKFDKGLLKNEQYKNAKGYRSRLAVFDYAVKKFNLWDWTAQHYDFLEVKNLLEVGCGTGDFWHHVSATGDTFEKIYLTDFSEGMLNTARDTLSGSPLFSKINFQIADVEDLTFPDKMFDVVLAHLMLYHPKSQEKSLSEMSRVLQKNGWVGITTLNIRSGREIFLVANKIDSRFPAYAVTVEPFDEVVASQLLPNYFRDIKKYSEEIKIRIPNSELLMEFIRTHPVSQTLELKDDFFKSFQDDVEKIIARDGFFETVFIPTLYVCTGVV